MFEQLVTNGALVLAQGDAPSSMGLLGTHLLAAIIFAVVGIAVLFACVFLIEKLTPFSVVKEIVEDQNQALGTIIGAIVLGISIIIAAAILG